MRTIVHTLGYNIPELIQEATISLYEKNKEGGFHHIIADLGYPLKNGRENWADVPKHIKENQHRNLVTNSLIAMDFESGFCAIPNKGVSPNWTNISRLSEVTADDILIGADPDERPMDDNWVTAMSEVMRHDPTIAVCSLALPELLVMEGFMEKYVLATRMINGIEVYYMKAMTNWALIGVSGRFINSIGGIPNPDLCPFYGWIEDACYPFMQKLGMTWVMLPKHRVQHIASSPLAQEWKNWSVKDGLDLGQISLDQWLVQYKGASW